MYRYQKSLKQKWASIHKAVQIQHTLYVRCQQRERVSQADLQGLLRAGRADR